MFLFSLASITIIDLINSVKELQMSYLLCIITYTLYPKTCECKLLFCSSSFLCKPALFEENSEVPLEVKLVIGEAISTSIISLNCEIITNISVSQVVIVQTWSMQVLGMRNSGGTPQLFVQSIQQVKGQLHRVVLP